MQFPLSVSAAPNHQTIERYIELVGGYLSKWHTHWMDSMVKVSGLSREAHLYPHIPQKIKPLTATHTFSITGLSSSVSMGMLVLVTHVLVHKCLNRTYEFLKVKSIKKLPKTIIFTHGHI